LHIAAVSVATDRVFDRKWVAEEKMEFGSLGLGSQTQSQTVSSQPGGSSTPAGSAAGATQSASLETNPENVVNAAADSGAAKGDRRQDLLGRAASDTANPARGANSDPGTDARAANAAADETASRQVSDPVQAGRKTTLNFDSELNRVFLEIVNTKTGEVIEQIPSKEQVKLVARALAPPDQPPTTENKPSESGTTQDSPAQNDPARNDPAQDRPSGAVPDATTLDQTS